MSIDALKLYNQQITHFLNAATETVVVGDKAACRQALKSLKQANALVGVVVETVREYAVANPPATPKKDK